MAKLLIKNLTAVPVTLPPPLAGVLTGGGSTVIALPNGGPTPSDLVAILSPYFGGAEVVEFVEVAEGNPAGPITFASSADLIGLSLNNSVGPVGFGGQRLVSVGAPSDASDAATKQYVDDNAGGSAASPAGAIQFNDTGPFGGDAALVWDNTSKTMTARNITTTGIVAVSNDIASGQVLSNTTPGTSNVVAPPTTSLKFVSVGAGSPLTLNSTTPFANGTVNGQVFWLFNSPDPMNGTFKIPSGGNVLAEYTAGTLDFAPGTIAQFSWLSAGNTWVQLGKAIILS